MKQAFLLIFSWFLCFSAYAQPKASYKDGVIYAGTAPYALLNKVNISRTAYMVQSLAHDDLIGVQAGHIKAKNKTGCVILFLNNGKQAMITETQDMETAIATSVVNGHLISADTINIEAEEKFIKSHPLPAGYLNIDNLREID